MRAHLPAPDRGRMDPAPARYMIRINGHLGATVLSAFLALAPRHHGAHTVLTGFLDRSAPYGALAARSRRSAWTCWRSASSPRTANHQDQVTTAHLDDRYRRARPFG
jgi:hypothetical protein